MNQLFVQFLTKELVPIEVYVYGAQIQGCENRPDKIDSYESTTSGEIKEQISEKINVPESDLRFIFAGHGLLDDERILDCNNLYKDNSIIHCVMRPTDKELMEQNLLEEFQQRIVGDKDLIQLNQDSMLYWINKVCTPEMKAKFELIKEKYTFIFQYHYGDYACGSKMKFHKWHVNSDGDTEQCYKNENGKNNGLSIKLQPNCIQIYWYDNGLLTHPRYFPGQSFYSDEPKATQTVNKLDK